MKFAERNTSIATLSHQYIDRATGQVRNEILHGDRIVRALYSPALESATWLLALASSARISSVLASLSYGSLLGSQATGMRQFLRESGINLSECLEPNDLHTARQIFERQIRFWEWRPMPPDRSIVVCPTYSRVIVGSLSETAALQIKEKLFDFQELLGCDRPRWLEAFRDGDFAVFRLTPEKYHYVHVPASGIVEDFYEIKGRYHSCNPNAVISRITPHSKNRRMVTILQTDVTDGAGIGRVAIIEVVALMVGQIVQCYSSEKYLSPRAVMPDMFLLRGQPKSLFRPGSSTVILLFQRGRVRFSEDLISNRFRPNVLSRFSLGFNQTIVETDVAVRSPLASPLKK